MTQQKVQAYIQLMRLDKPVGIYLLLWPTLWALLIAADGWPPLDVTLVFVAGVVVMRSAGCVINDYADRHVDGAVKRTSERPLATGALSAAEALTCFGLLIVIAFLLVLTLNVPTILLSVGALALASSYPFMKRYTHLPQVVLGAAFGWSIPMAFSAVTGEVPLVAWWLFLANLAWTVAYDTYYAMVDRDDDIKIGVKSTAVLFGRYDLAIIVLLQALFLSILMGLTVALSLGWAPQLALVLGVMMVAYQAYIARRRERDACFRAFLLNHWVGAVFTLGLVAEILLR